MFVHRQTLLVIFWTLLGFLLRFQGLTLKPIWGDEWSTLVFSLGNGYQQIPFDLTMPIATLLSPLQPPEGLQFAAVIDRLHQESNHPPLFFLLLHLWLHLFPPGTNGWVSISAARLFSVCFGVVAIPFTYALIRQWTRTQPFSLWASQACTALMALSPFGVYLSQEARHYTLSVLWILALLYCLERSLQPRPLPWWLVFAWIVVNSLGLATHFFYGIDLLAAAVLLIISLGFGVRGSPNPEQSPGQLWARGRRLSVVALGTIATALLWLPTWQGIGGTSLTTWLERRELFAPLGRLLLWVLTAILLLPVEGVPGGVAIASGIIVLGAFFYSLRFLWQAWWDKTPFLGMLLQFVGVNGLIFLGLIYGLNSDLSVAPRYQFVYFPALILGFGLAFAWQGFQYPQSRKTLISLYVIALLGSFSVSTNLAFQKSEQSDRFLANLIAQYPPSSAQTLSTQTLPLIFTTPYENHGDTGYLMSLAWQWQHDRQAPGFPFTAEPQFLLLSDQSAENDRLATILGERQEPYLLGLINFAAPYSVEALGCVAQVQAKAPGYWSEFYQCQPGQQN
ncbi:MAG: glycosyltransferase family 39 protein [Prochlorotrichaceae cyanobacterium]